MLLPTGNRIYSITTSRIAELSEISRNAGVLYLALRTINSTNLNPRTYTSTVLNQFATAGLTHADILQGLRSLKTIGLIKSYTYDPLRIDWDRSFPEVPTEDLLNLKNRKIISDSDYALHLLRSLNTLSYLDLNFSTLDITYGLSRAEIESMIQSQIYSVRQTTNGAIYSGYLTPALTTFTVQFAEMPSNLWSREELMYLRSLNLLNQLQYEYLGMRLLVPEFGIVPTSTLFADWGIKPDSFLANQRIFNSRDLSTARVNTVSGTWEEPIFTDDATFLLKKKLLSSVSIRHYEAWKYAGGGTLDVVGFERSHFGSDGLPIHPYDMLAILRQLVQLQLLKPSTFTMDLVSDYL